MLGRDNLMVFSARLHPLASRKAVKRNELDGLPLITLTRDSDIRLLVEIGYEAARIKLVPSYEVSLISTALAMVESGLGIGVFPTYAWGGSTGTQHCGNAS
jgi:DNA-binding transcriptional LysR family regulator